MHTNFGLMLSISFQIRDESTCMQGGMGERNCGVGGGLPPAFLKERKRGFVGILPVVHFASCQSVSCHVMITVFANISTHIE